MSTFRKLEKKQRTFKIMADKGLLQLFCYDSSSKFKKFSISVFKISSTKANQDSRSLQEFLTGEKFLQKLSSEVKL